MTSGEVEFLLELFSLSKGLDSRELFLRASESLLLCGGANTAAVSPLRPGVVAIMFLGIDSAPREGRE